MNEKDIRAILGRFLFVQDDVKKVINDLSVEKSSFAISATYASKR